MADTDATKRDWMRGLSLGERIVASQQIEADKQQRVLGIGKYDRQPLTADQQIRAKALECFSIAYAGSLLPDQPADFYHVQEFERYIREGK